MDTKLKEYLEKNDISYVLHEHERVFTVEESKKIKKSIPGLATKNLFLKSKDNFYLLLMPAESRLNTKNLRKILNLRDIKFGSPEELKRHLNTTPGSVSLFNMIYTPSVILLIDESVYKADITGFHPNDNSETLEIKNKDFKKFLNSLKSEKKIISLENE